MSTFNNSTETLRYDILLFTDIGAYQLKQGFDIQNIDFVAGAFDGSIFLDMLNFCGYDQPWSLGKQMHDMLKILPRLRHHQPNFFKWDCSFHPRALAHIITAVRSDKFILLDPDIYCISA